MSSENISFEQTLDLANNNDHEAQYNIGLAFEVGIGVKKDLEQAYSWYLKSAEGDFPKAQYSLGLCWLWGKGVIRILLSQSNGLKKHMRMDIPLEEHFKYERY